MLLKHFRKKKHLTQSEVAEKLQISVRQYQRIESGRSFPRESSLIILEDLFEAPHRVLFAESVEDIPDFLKCFLP
ncbi:helix-turn-helix domain-containing protein [Lederbergia lenta]|uniref:helix-turn-helix domain-containing protein n=1 Tax=Lederbergia lenta TaxID=1467 RepID=UPI00203B7191|nr:helix-turn-helix domain-containing protein [Lederbergia lenta]